MPTSVVSVPVFVDTTDEVRRAFATFDIKAVDDEQRVISGFTSTPSPDRVGDVLDPKGAQFSLPLPLLWQHRQDQPIGQVVDAKVSAEGIYITAQIAPDDVAPYIAEAWKLIKAKLVRAFSVGWKPTDDPKVANGVFLWPKWLWLETSAVTVPANADCTIARIKSLADAELAALGPRAASLPAGASASREPTRSRKVFSTAVQPTYTERVKDLESQIETKKSDLFALQDKVTKEGRTKDASEREQFDNLQREIADYEVELKDVKALEVMSVQQAVPANGKSVEDAAAARGGYQSIRVEPVKLPPGIGFARAVKAFGVARMDGRNPVDVVKTMYPSDTKTHAHVAFQQNLPNVISQIKNTIVAATTTGSQWADALMDPTNLAGEFIELLRPATIIGRLNLRNIPFNVRVIAQTSGGNAYWVGQGAPKPLTEFRFSPTNLGPTKVATIAVATEESVRLSTPSLDTIFRDALREAVIERIDRDLLDPAEAGSPGVQPASLTNGVTPLNTAGTSADNARTDIGALVRKLRTSNLRGPIVLVMPDSLLTALSLMVNALGQPSFPGLNLGDQSGGTIQGFRVIGSEYVANGSGFGNMVVAIAEREIFLADDGQVTVDLSREASLQMLDNPTNNSATGTPTQMVSMWQTNSVAFRAERWINWAKRRSDAVAYIDDVNWGSIGSP